MRARAPERMNARYVPNQTKNGGDRPRRSSSRMTSFRSGIVVNGSVPCRRRVVGGHRDPSARQDGAVTVGGDRRGRRHVNRGGGSVIAHARRHVGNGGRRSIVI